MGTMKGIQKQELERLYAARNCRRFVDPDPLVFLYDYPCPEEREVVGLIASALAYGRVAGILSSVRDVLSRMNGSPYDFACRYRGNASRRALAGFRHRFTDGEDMADLVRGIGRTLRRYGSLNECFLACMNESDATVYPALSRFAGCLGCAGNSLLPDPARGSACKRLNLFLRWMVRKDAVDPGGWRGVPRSMLVVPLDTHMACIGRKMGFTSRKTADMRMALDVTEGFRRICPEDPAKYDFALTRYGIRNELGMSDLEADLEPTS